MPTPYSHTEGRLLAYDAEAAPVQRRLWAAVTAAQDEPSLAPWLGPAEQHAYRSMPAAAVDKVVEHLHAAHDALARTVGRRQPSPTGWTRQGETSWDQETARGGDPPLQRPESVRASGVPGERGPARHPLRGSAPTHGGAPGCIAGFRRATQSQVQEELERQAATLGEDIRHLRALLAADCKRAIKDFWRRHAQDIAQRWKAVRGAIEEETPGPLGLWNVRVPNTQTLLTEAHDVMFAVRALWRELYDKRPVHLPGLQAVLGRHVPRLPEGAWARVQQYSMQDLRSALDQADGKAPGPNHVEARFIKAFRAPVQWLLVHSYRAILRGRPPPMHWRDAQLGAGLRQTRRLPAHSPGTTGHEATHGSPHQEHHGGAHATRRGQRLAAGGPPRLEYRPPPVHGAAAAPAGKAQLRLLLRSPQGLRSRRTAHCT